MANEDKKDFNAIMRNSKDMPKITEIKDEAGIRKWGGKTLVIAPPIDYDYYIKKVPCKMLTTSLEIRKQLARKYNAEVCCPLTAGIFINICAWASYQRQNDKTPYWRVVKNKGELNEKFPGGALEQAKMLESEGHEIICKNLKDKKYFVKDYEKAIYTF